MSFEITGRKHRPVEHLQNRLDNFIQSSNAHKAICNKLDAWKAESVELADIPAHEARLQALLVEYKIATEALKRASEKIRDKTDEAHINKYFRSRYNILKGSSDRNTYIDLQHKEPLKAIHQVAIQILGNDYETQITEAQNASLMRSKEAQAAIEFSLIHQSFPECQERLLRENPSEYLRQANLYQHKLLENNDVVAVLTFGELWIKNLPKEASWEQVENMSFVILEAARKTDQADLTEYRAGVEKWLKEHPPSENPALILTSPAQAATPLGQQIHVLGLLYLTSPKLDLSPEAFQVYQNCSILYPDQHLWKVSQAFYLMSKLQWIEAEELLNGLPEEDPSVINARKCLSDHFLSCEVNKVYDHISEFRWIEAEQLLAGLSKEDPLVINAQKCLANYRLERICSAGLDLGAIALSRLTPSSYRDTTGFDVIQTIVQGTSNPSIRGVWLPRLLKTSQPSTPNRDLILPLAIDMVDVVFRNIPILRPFQKIETFAGSGFRMLNSAKILYSNSQQRLPSSFINLGSSFISATQTLDELREIRRPAAHLAILSTVQQIASDILTAQTILSYKDLLPLIGVSTQQLVGSRFIPLMQTPSTTRYSSKAKWIFTAIGVGSVAAYRFTLDYPYLWAASVMKEAESYYYQGKHSDATRVLTDAENSYCTSKALPAVRTYAQYGNHLKNYPKLLEDRAKYQQFISHLNLVLNTLKPVSHYRGIRNSLLLRKIEVSIHQQDPQMLNEVIKDGPPAKIVDLGFNHFLGHTYHLAVKNQIAADTFLQKMRPSFPPRFHFAIDALSKLLQTHLTSLQEWCKLNVFSLLQNRPTLKSINRWENGLQELQSYFQKHLGKMGVYQELQYTKLTLSLAQQSSVKTQSLFKESDAEIHHRLSYEVILFSLAYWKAGRHKKALETLQKMAFEPFKDSLLIQKYCHFFSLLDAFPSQGEKALKQREALDACITELKLNDNYHKELHVILLAYKVVLHLDAGEYTDAKSLLDKENSKVPTEAAALLFERVFAFAQENEPGKALKQLDLIINNLGSWRHHELFKAYQAHLLSEPSLEAQLQSLSPLISELKSTERFSDFASHLQLRSHLLQFTLFLSQENLDQAKDLLNGSIPKELYSELCKVLTMFLINRGEELRQTKPLSQVRETIETLYTFFAISNSTIIQSYLQFLIHREKIENTTQISTLEEAKQSLMNVFEKLKVNNYPHPETLNTELVNLLLKIVLQAKASNQPKTALAALESIKELGVPLDHLDEYIIDLKQSLGIN